MNEGLVHFAAFSIKVIRKMGGEIDGWLYAVIKIS